MQEIFLRNLSDILYLTYNAEVKRIFTIRFFVCSQERILFTGFSTCSGAFQRQYSVYISIFKHFLELTAPNKNILIVTRLSGSATCSGYFYFCVISVYTSLFFNFRSNSKTSFLHNSIASLQVSTSSPSISMLSSPGYLVEK